MSAEVLFFILSVVIIEAGIIRVNARAYRAEKAKREKENADLVLALSQERAKNEKLIKEHKAVHAAEHHAHMREAQHRGLNLAMLDALLVTARSLFAKEADDACDDVLLKALDFLDKQVALRRKDHGDLHALLHCFERGDRATLRTMLNNLELHRPTEFHAITDRFPKSVEDFFCRLTAADDPESLPLMVP